MAVRLTLLAAPLLGVTLVLLALLPPSSHVASSTLAAQPSPGATAPTTSTPKPLPCSSISKGDGESRGKREARGCNMSKGASPQDDVSRMSKRAVSGDFEEEKRAPSNGFFGMRGKKDADGELDALKRAPSSGFFGMRGKKAESDGSSDGASEESYDENQLNQAEKRAPNSGFFGMRGKKYPYVGYAPWYRDPKRARMGFFGTRGKKSEGADDEEISEDKRAPAMGFFGSRGKKAGEYEDLPYEWAPLELENVMEDKRAPMGFFGMRGKKSDDEGYAVDTYDQEKRAPMGFFGMRGKKSDGSVDGAINEDVDMEKRAPMGFFGMRGKKDDGDFEDGFQDPKRAPMGFFGMRGKKDQGELWSEDMMQGEDKRAPMGFFGMRGKKDSGDDASSGIDYLEEDKRAPMGFFGMRGKKGDEMTPPEGWYLYPEAKRSFTAAAAAAWPAAIRRNSFTLDSLLAYLAGRDVGTTHTGNGWRPVRKRFRGNKKAPMGFIGMRGKKSSALSREVWPPSSNCK
ncbi:hypothetical protein J437_LFUL005762 [Ladona fulva]|uniref:Uncharacterized protein n=1 Tax=Ladona fulva TaxID=123851 RepID=A0A8K0K4X9_LADFU|nr:hypothetical protein J437_LFUL005762 [Ladona fulva]